jgi:hypothetical protein
MSSARLGSAPAKDSINRSCQPLTRSSPLSGPGALWLPEFLLLKGDLLLALPDANGGAAETWFLRAFEVAQKSDARMPQLRAAIGLCRLQRERGDAKQGSGLLSATYATFTEGFTTPDLIDAAELLEPAPQESGGGDPSIP